MECYLIRHGHAVKREDWEDEDMRRPLTEEGEERADAAFARFCNIFSPPHVILTSAAERARRTAACLAAHCEGRIREDPRLNPGATVNDYENVLQAFEAYDPVALVGHEPDLSSYISHVLAGDALDLEVKKGAICHIREDTLLGLIQQKVLR